VRERVVKRARHRCEYCQAPQNICAYTFHLEHILPRSKGGTDKLSNYALACFYCKSSKATHTTGIDPETGQEVPLFHPRKDKWEEHFRWSKGFISIHGLTPRGRATVERLKMNIHARKEGRELWRLTDQWP
jgi:5-methylcytosine-specific restriction endonuclease McrA